MKTGSMKIQIDECYASQEKEKFYLTAIDVADGRWRNDQPKSWGEAFSMAEAISHRGWISPTQFWTKVDGK